jgi:hypothetical protein
VTNYLADALSRLPDTELHVFRFKSGIICAFEIEGPDYNPLFLTFSRVRTLTA